jgi:hypothetical protein
MVYVVPSPVDGTRSTFRPTRGIRRLESLSSMASGAYADALFRESTPILET